jgi:hypothetical protein
VWHTLEVCHTGDGYCGIAHGAQFFLLHSALLFKVLIFNALRKIARLIFAQKLPTFAHAS